MSTSQSKNEAPVIGRLFYYLKNIMKTYEKILLALAFVLTAFSLFVNRSDDSVRPGSVTQGSDYQATTTDQTWPTLTPKIVKSEQGTLGTVTITTAGTGSLTIYDATTTNIALRGNVATSTITLAHFAVTATVGTYVFDRVFFNGLIVVYTGTNTASTTITYR